MRLTLGWALTLIAALMVPVACGGGGGGGGPVVLALTSLSVTSQPGGTAIPFGTTGGGDTVVLNGTGFEAGLTVQFGTAAGTVVTVTATRVTCTSPAVAAEGIVTITVRNPGGEESTLAGSFEYIAPPSVLGILALTGPTTGENRAPIKGGDTLQLTGTNFRDGMTITIDGKQAVTTFVNATTATCLAPPATGDSVVNVAVRNPEGLVTTFVNGLVYTQEFSLDPATNTLTQARATHLYRRAGFGAPPDVIATAIATGLSATVTRLVDFTNDDAVEDAAQTHYGQVVLPDANLNNRTNQQWWIHMLVKNPNPFQDRIAWFMHDHFATSGAGFNNDFTWTLNEQVQLLRRFSVRTNDQTTDGRSGLGYNWRALLVEICKDRAMLDWLDGRVSSAANPNENFARELWELFMLGEGNGYTEDDIKEAARAFTGMFWYRTGGRTGDDELDIAYRPGRHDSGSKTVLGATGNFGYDSVSPFYDTSTGPQPNGFVPGQETDPNDTEGIVSVTLRQRPVLCSQFICRKLAEFFLYEDVADVIVDELAADLRAPGANQWNLRPILLKILRSKAFFSSRAIKGKVKNPVEFAVGFLRTSEIDLHPELTTNTRRIYDRLVAMEQVPLDPPDVNGWPTGTAWMAAQAMVERYNFLNFSVQQLEDVNAQIDPLLPPEGQRTPTELVDHIARLFDVQLSGTARTKYVDYVTSAINDSGQQVPAPFDPTNDTQLKNKSRGLIYMIALYHDAHQD